MLLESGGRYPDDEMMKIMTIMTIMKIMTSKECGDKRSGFV